METDLIPDRDDKPGEKAPHGNQSPSAKEERTSVNADHPIGAKRTESDAESPLHQNIARHDDPASSISQDIGNGNEPLGDDHDGASEGGSIAPVAPLPELTDLSDPVFALEAPKSIPDNPEGSVADDDTGNRLSEQIANELIKLIEDALAAKEASPEAVSADKLEAIVVRLLNVADSKTGEEADAPAAPDADSPRAPSAPRADQGSRDIDRFAGGSFRRPEPAGDPLASAGRDGALPRVIVMVELVSAREIIEEDRRKTAEEMAAMQREIAASEVKQGFWEYGNQKRAADYRLRGPH